MTAIDVGGFFQDSHAALGELFVLQVNIDHQVAIHIPEAGHSAGGEHVQDHLLRRACLHASGPGNDLWADFGNNGDVGGLFQLRVPIAGDCHSFRSPRAGVLKGGDCEGSTSAGGDADDNVVLARLSFRDFVSSQFAGVFVGFDGGAQRFRSAGDDELDQLRIGVKGGRAFGGVERGDASAGAGADIDEASAIGERGGDEIDGSGDLRQSALYGRGDLGVFGVDEAGDF
jgi:hypothetical protein